MRNGDGPIRAEDIAPFLEKHIPPADRARYNLRIAEFLAGICVVVQIDWDGIIELDIAQGTLPPLTGGLITPEFVATNKLDEHNISGRLQYFRQVVPGRTKPGGPILLPAPSNAEEEESVLNTSVRAAIWRGIRMIPAYDGASDVRQARLPGRYELAIVQHGSIQTPIFADAQPFTRTSIV